MPHDLSAPTFEFTGAARLHRAASGGMMGWAAQVRGSNSQDKELLDAAINRTSNVSSPK